MFAMLDDDHHVTGVVTLDDVLKSVIGAEIVDRRRIAEPTQVKPE